MAAFAAGKARRKRLAIGPDGAVLEVFFLPDGHGAFQSINEPAAGFESGGAVGRGDHNGDAGLADLQTAEAVHEGNIADGKFRQRLLRQQFHLFERHFRISFVIQVERAATAGVVADYSLENYGSAVVGLLDFFEKRLRVDWLMDDGSVMAVSGCSATEFGWPEPPLTGGSRATSSPDLSWESGGAYS